MHLYIYIYNKTISDGSSHTRWQISKSNTINLSICGTISELQTLDPWPGLMFRLDHWKAEISDPLFDDAEIFVVDSPVVVLFLKKSLVPKHATLQRSPNWYGPKYVPVYPWSSTQIHYHCNRKPSLVSGGSKPFLKQYLRIVWKSHLQSFICNCSIRLMPKNDQRSFSGLWRYVHAQDKLWEAQPPSWHPAVITSAWHDLKIKSFKFLCIQAMYAISDFAFTPRKKRQWKLLDPMLLYQPAILGFLLVFSHVRFQHVGPAHITAMTLSCGDNDHNLVIMVLLFYKQLFHNGNRHRGS